MIQFLKKYKYLLLTFLLSFAIFYPSLFVFFTNDDFFFLKISQAKNINGFFNFFNLISGPDGFGMYRPLTTQVFYFLSTKLFNLEPLPLHIISFLVFFAIIFLIYKLGFELFKSAKIGLIAAFLYSVSATHFGHLYYLATFQELGMTFFVLLSCLAFLEKRNLLSFCFFALALLSKETAVVTPALLFLIYFYQNNEDIGWNSFKKILVALLPFAICLFAYFLIRLRWYGFASGNSYVWNFSISKLFNTSFWYLLWSLNVPESLVDFIGPDLKVNPNLFLYWNNQIMPILISFFVQCALLVLVLVKVLFEKTKNEITKRDNISLFCIVWFLTALLPVIFLPEHKFTFYLTLPMVGLVFRLSYLLVSSKVGNIFIGLFLTIWTVTSILTLKFTVQTNWITQGELISNRAYSYFKANQNFISAKTLSFVDTKDDLSLPFSPTATLKTSLSDNNFFKVFFPKLSNKISYFSGGQAVINSRQFLGY